MRKTQNEKLIDYLLLNGSISSKQAEKFLRIKNVRARTDELRKNHWEIRTEMRMQKNSSVPRATYILDF